MHNFHIEFAYPWSGWLLFLIIPALALTLIPYFMLNKKYRRTRNRIISIVLHIIVMVLAISALAGVTFAYQVNNLENEIIILVDVSDTEEQSAELRDDYVEAIINESQYDGFKVGVVTFGFTQNYAVPLTYEINTIFDRYLDANIPDTSATDIAAALKYASTLFTPEYLKSSKIVLITDGKETDENASSVIRSIAAQGTRVDMVYVPSEFEKDNAQVLGVKYPEFHVNLNETFTMEVTVQCKTALDTATIELYDNGELNSVNGTVTQSLNVGKNTLTFSHMFMAQGLHEITIKITDTEDGLKENNEFCSYYFLNVYDKILILEQQEGQSEALKTLLTTDGNEFKVEILNFNRDLIPETVDELREYDQIILNNIANSDLPEGFDKLLDSYVRDYGGGLFTTGGVDDNGEAHAYSRRDMRNSVLQDLLPVQVIDYTPPVGVVVIIDVSGSMTSAGDGGMTQLQWAQEGAVACLDALTERDYIAVMTLDTVYGMILPLTARTQETVIKEAIMGISPGGSTNFTGAIRRANLELAGDSRIDKRHIIIVTDGQPTEPPEGYLNEVNSAYVNNGITVSVVGIGMTAGSSAALTMQEIIDLGHGRLHLASGSQLIPEMREDLNAPEIKEISDEPFNPVVADPYNMIFNGIDWTDGEGGRTLEAQLGGFFGTKKRNGIEPLLVGEFEVPLYAQWKVGKGTVGSFLCDLYGNWSSEFMADANGKRFIINAINNLMPTEDIQPNALRVELKEDNYINQLSIVTDLEEDQRVEAKIYTPDNQEISLNALTELPADGIADCYVTLALNKDNQYSRCAFVAKNTGIYRIVISKFDKDGNVLAELELYKSFAYSEEYVYYDEEDEFQPNEYLENLANRGNGVIIDDIDRIGEIFANFVTDIDKSFDPRILFMIIAMVLFLLDIAVRKFKFKWPHEIYREYKEKKASEK